MTAFRDWWRGQLKPPAPTLAQCCRLAREAFAAGAAAERERLLASLQPVAEEYDRQAGCVALNDEIVRRAYVARDMIAAIRGGA